MESRPEQRDEERVCRRLTDIKGKEKDLKRLQQEEKKLAIFNSRPRQEPTKRSRRLAEKTERFGAIVWNHEKEIRSYEVVSKCESRAQTSEVPQLAFQREHIAEGSDQEGEVELEETFSKLLFRQCWEPLQ